MNSKASDSIGLFLVTFYTPPRLAYKCISRPFDIMKLNISNPATGAQKLYEFEEEKNL